MTSARSVAFGTAIAMKVPGTSLDGAVRKVSSLAASQVMPDLVSAGEYLKFATDAALRPTRPFIEGAGRGPVSTTVEWQTPQRCLNSAPPLVASPAGAA